MEKIFTKNLQRIIIINLCLLALFLVAKTIATFSEVIKKPAQITAQNSITFSGTASVETKPDIATFFVTINKEAKSANESRQEMAKAMNDVISLLNSKKIDKKDIQTTNYNIHPKYNYQNIRCIKSPCEPSKRVLSGYDARQTISVTLRNVDESKQILSDLAKLEVGNVGNLSFSVSDVSKFKDEAQLQAIKNAKEKAKITAKNLGIKLGKIISFNESEFYQPPHIAFSSKSILHQEADQIAVNIESGEKKISSTVSITYEVR